MQGATTFGETSIEIAYISIHAPYAGGDVNILAARLIIYEFQSTPPMQGATLA